MRLARTTVGKEAKLSYMGHLLTATARPAARRAGERSDLADGSASSRSVGATRLRGIGAEQTAIRKAGIRDGRIDDGQASRGIAVNHGRAAAGVGWRLRHEAGRRRPPQ